MNAVKLLWTGMALLLASATAVASNGTAAPAVELKTPWMAIVYAAVSAVGILAVGFKNAKRTHLD